MVLLLGRGYFAYGNTNADETSSITPKRIPKRTPTRVCYRRPTGGGRFWIPAFLSLLLGSPFLCADQATSLVSEHSVGADVCTETLARDGNLVFVARRHDGCAIVDMTNPATPQTITTVNPDPGTTDIWDVAALNGKLYLMNQPEAVDTNLGNWVGLYIYEVSKPTASILDGYLLWGGGVWHHLGGSTRAGTVAEINGSTYVFLCSLITSVIEVFDVTNASAPIFVTSIQGPGSFDQVFEVVVQDDTLYSAWMSGGFMIHDVTIPGLPQVLGQQAYLGSPTINGGLKTLCPTPDGTHVVTGEYTLQGDVRL